jgi:predicted O-methyltransferase YrrM
MKLDFGAGRETQGSYPVSVRHLAINSGTPPAKGRLLYKLAKRVSPGYALELGTSLGLSAACIKLAAPGCHLTTMEGAPEVAGLARQNFKKLGFDDIMVREGRFADTLPDYLTGIPALDLAFFDGDHRYEPTVNYYLQCAEKAGNDSLFIFDDIHWSPDMERAWNFITHHEQNTLTIDLFDFGLVFFRKESTKEHYIIRY